MAKYVETEMLDVVVEIEKKDLADVPSHRSELRRCSSFRPIYYIIHAKATSVWDQPRSTSCFASSTVHSQALSPPVPYIFWFCLFYALYLSEDYYIKHGS